MKYTVQIEIDTDGGLALPSFTADPGTPVKLLRSMLSRLSDKMYTDTDHHFKKKYDASHYPSPTVMDEELTGLTVKDLYPENQNSAPKLGYRYAGSDGTPQV